MTTWITICDTCKHEGWDANQATATDGETLAELVEAEVRLSDAAIRTRRVSCLMGCSHACNIAIQAETKLSYTLGRFDPVAEDAKAIVDYAARHAASETGQVPYREWPEGVKGHFVTRHPPLPE